MKRKEGMALDFAEQYAGTQPIDMTRYQSLCEGYIAGFDACKKLIEEHVLSKRIAKGIARITGDDVSKIGEDILALFNEKEGPNKKVALQQSLPRLG
jgi:hypothetical protein